MVRHDYERRLRNCSELMSQAGFNSLLLAKPSNMAYLTGDGRLCAYAMVSREGKVLLGVPKTDVEDVRRSARFDVLDGFEDEVGMVHSIAHAFERIQLTNGSVGLEYTYLTLSMMGMFTHPHAKPPGVTVKDCTHILSELRTVKDAGEVELIKAAAKVADAGMAAAVKAAETGMTESHVAAAAEYAMRNADAEEFWRTYISSGPRTNIAHGLLTQRKLAQGDLVMIDLHPIVNGYSADICRTVCLGRPVEPQAAAYDAYLTAQQVTISRAREGIGVAELERILQGSLRDAGYGECLGPPIHGVGIDFEESPLPPGHAFFHGEKEPSPLRANVVIAVGNCGLYTGPWGVRVEDTLVVGPQGPTVLTTFERRLEI
ncbi:MAG: aminopeptidase P family protein [Chloroflexi bacterium]|nr:aminopeptidase P family protein [Chloroflexota bacterium]